MKPEDFARQFLDMWQDSLNHAMESPTYNTKLLHMLEDSNDFWGDDKKNENDNHINDTPNQQLTQLNDDSHGSVQELASRLEKCEQRICVLEAIIRAYPRTDAEAGKRREERERNARIQISNRAG